MTDEDEGPENVLEGIRDDINGLEATRGSEGILEEAEALLSGDMHRDAI